MILLLLATALLAADPDRAPADGSLRIATFNIRYGAARDGEDRWEKRRDMLFRTVKKMDADVIGMQEVLAFQAEELRKALPEYEFLGVGRDDGKEKGEFVPVFFKANKFEKLASGYFWLSEQPDTPGSRGWDAALPRVTTWVRLRDRATMRTFLFVNTHFDHKGVKAREESAKLLRARVEQLRESGPAVITGDFNSTDDQPAYANLLGQGAKKLIDIFRTIHPKRGPEEGTFNGFTGKRDGGRIDWIIHTPDFTADSCEIVRDSERGRYPSDHYPVLAKISASERKQKD